MCARECLIGFQCRVNTIFSLNNVCTDVNRVYSIEEANTIQQKNKSIYIYHNKFRESTRRARMVCLTKIKHVMNRIIFAY